MKGRKVTSTRQRRPFARRHQGNSWSGKRLGRKSTLGLFLLLTLGLWVAYLQARAYFRQPQVLLVLGGEPAREKFAAKFALEHPDLPIWVSSGSPKEYSEWVFEEAGVDLHRVKLDYRAVDTLTNFTTLVSDLDAKGIKSVYLLTSDYHMRRSKLIGEIVLGSHGIDVKTVVIPSEQPQEEMSKALRDGGRALVWVATGYTGQEKKLAHEEQLAPSP
jgi:uncharacterized SAM-binding protein YcdF (DUF218 family)